MNAAIEIGTAAISSGSEWAVVGFEGPDGNVYITSGFTDNQPKYIDLGDLAANAPPGYTPIFYQHAHPERYPSDYAAIDEFTNNHFSIASDGSGDEGVAQSQQVDGYVLIGGTDDVFEWDHTNASLTAPDRKVGNTMNWAGKKC